MPPRTASAGERSTSTLSAPSSKPALKARMSLQAIVGSFVGLYAFTAVSLLVYEYQTEKNRVWPGLEAEFRAYEADPPQLRHFGGAILVAALLTAFRLRVTRPFSDYMARVCGVSPKNYSKFEESVFKIVLYSSTFSLGVAVAWHEEWLWDCSALYHDFPFHLLSLPQRLFFMTQLGSYLAMVGMLLFLDTVRKDFAEMLIHHIATIVLIVLSYFSGGTHYGVVILIIHDINDILLEAAKLLLYLGFKTVADCMFGAFVVAWMVFRLGRYPYVVYSTVAIFDLIPYPWTFELLLNTLVVLHVYWFWLIARMVVRLMKIGNVEKDIRSDSDTD